eukprot:7391889-Prymnesium_polylepis.1
MARVRDARTTRAGSHAEVEHQAGAGTARGSVMQGVRVCTVRSCVCLQLMFNRVKCGSNEKGRSGTRRDCLSQAIHPWGLSLTRASISDQFRKCILFSPGTLNVSIASGTCVCHALYIPCGGAQ